MKTAYELIESECVRATDKHGGFNSIHESYSVILEEVDEYWEEVKKKTSKRDKSNMAVELVQIAAMCVKALESFNLVPEHPENKNVTRA